MAARRRRTAGAEEPEEPKQPDLPPPPGPGGDEAPTTRKRVSAKSATPEDAQDALRMVYGIGALFMGEDTKLPTDREIREDAELALRVAKRYKWLLIALTALAPMLLVYRVVRRFQTMWKSSHQEKKQEAVIDSQTQQEEQTAPAAAAGETPPAQGEAPAVVNLVDRSARGRMQRRGTVPPPQD